MEKTISDKIKTEIIKNIIEPFYINDIKNAIKGRRWWLLAANIVETMSKVLVALCTIFSFSAGFFNYPLLSFIAGTLSTAGLATLQFSSFAYGKTKRNTSELNMLLEKLHIEKIPTTEFQSTTNTGDDASINTNATADYLPDLITDKNKHITTMPILNDSSIINGDCASTNVIHDKNKHTPTIQPTVVLDSVVNKSKHITTESIASEPSLQPDVIHNT